MNGIVQSAEMQIDIANMQDSVHILFVSFTLHLKLNCCAKFVTKYIIIIVRVSTVKIDFFRNEKANIYTYSASLKDTLA